MMNEKTGETHRPRGSDQSIRWDCFSLVTRHWPLATCHGLLVAAALLMASCGARHGAVRTYLDEPFPQKLSDWRLFIGKPSLLQSNQGVIPYDLNTPLFKDYASKRRFVWMPPGTAAVYSPTGTFDFPVGTILAKTFFYPQQLSARSTAADDTASSKGLIIETRLLVHARSGWVGLPYVWNDDQTEATLDLAPDPITLKRARPTGETLAIDYVIPNANQCKQCHEDRNKVMHPIGPKARNLNRDLVYAGGRDNQLAYWTKVGYLKGSPPSEQVPKATVWNDPASGSLAARARTYLDVNCAHCHNPDGPANNSGLYLASDVADPLRLGVCKVPVAAGKGTGGLRFDVVPGKPEESILAHRLESDQPKVMMPEIGRSLVDREGAALVRDWIASMPGGCPE